MAGSSTATGIPLLDLVFCCDCTSSMTQYIASAQQSIRNIAREISEAGERDLRFALVKYRDHPPQDSTFATQVHAFTNSLETMQAYVDTMRAEGGGDGPESVACAMKEVLDLPYRINCIKICVIIADAPPHGVSQVGDGFPDGCPCGVDPVAIAHEMARQGIVLFCVGVEPNLGAFPYAREFYKGIAKITEGRFLTLGNAHLLPKIIVGGSIEEADLENLAQDVEAECAAVRADDSALSEEAVIERVHERLASRGVKAAQLKVSDQVEVSEAWSCYTEAPTLQKARKKAEKLAPAVGHAGPPPGVVASRACAVPKPVLYEAQTASYEVEEVSMAQISKVMSRASKRT